MESKGTFFKKNAMILKMIYYSFYIGTSQVSYETLRKENMMTKDVKYTAKITKIDLAKDYQIVNSKATNPKFKI